jgi:hypothetical protein
MPKANSDEGRERLRQLVVAFVTELMKPVDAGSMEAVGEHAIAVDGLAGDLLETEAEGAVVLLGDVSARAVKALAEKIGTDPLVILDRISLEAVEAGP